MERYSSEGVKQGLWSLPIQELLTQLLQHQGQLLKAWLALTIG